MPAPIWRWSWSGMEFLLTVDWNNFEQGDAPDQARFLLDCATRALPALEGHDDIAAKVAAYLDAARDLLDGATERHAEVTRFLDDPEMAEDFTVYYAKIEEDERACAAMDIATYACGYVARITAPAAGVTRLPDPVLESLPEVSDYYAERAAFLGL